jgi:hypothetical protein
MGETAHRRGAYPRGRPGKFKGLLRQGTLMGLRRVAASPIRPFASWLLAPALITDLLITDYCCPSPIPSICAGRRLGDSN